jgi:hypothetical protein
MFKDQEYYRRLSISLGANDIKNNITKICFFDFDGCIVNSPTPETHMEIYKQKTGNEWKGRDWWANEETLDHTIFDIEPFSSVVNILNRENSKKNVLTVLMTARISKLENRIITLLDHLNIKLDHISTKDSNLEKDQRILEFIEYYPNLIEIDVYDDRDKEIIIFVPLKDKLLEHNITLNIYKVTEGHIVKI